MTSSSSLALALAIALSTAFAMGSAHAASGAGQAADPPATILAQAAEEALQAVILDLTLTKGGANELKPSLRVPLGGEASIEAAPGLTVNVTRALLVGKQLSLRIGVSEAMPQGLMESLTAIDVPVDKPVKLQLGSDPARSWLIEFTPRVTPAPAKRAS